MRDRALTTVATLAGELGIATPDASTATEQELDVLIDTAAAALEAYRAERLVPADPEPTKDE